jgi:hypothetical protein
MRRITQSKSLNPTLSYRFNVRFKSPEIIDGKQMFGNDFKSATVKAEGYYGNRVSVVWDNGFSCKTNPMLLEFQEIPIPKPVTIAVEEV